MTFFLISLSLCLGYIFFKKRYFDVFTFIVLVSLYYSSPLFMGVLYDPSAHQVVEITSKLYIFYGFYYLFLFLVIFVFDSRCASYKLVTDGDCSHFRAYVIPLAALSLMFFLILLAIDPVFYFPNSVDDAKVSQFGVFYPLFCFSTMLALIFSILSRNKLMTIVFLCLMVLTLIAGSRTYIAFTAAIGMFFIGASIGRIRLATNVKLGAAGLFGFLFLFFYKIFYPFLLDGNFSGILDSIANPELIAFRLFKGSESVLVMLNLHYSIEREWVFDSEYTIVFLVRMIPFISPFLADALGVELVRYSDVLKVAHYQHIGFGMASTAWGQFFYLIGYLAYVMPLVVFILVYFGNKLFFSGRREFVFLLPPMVMLAISLTRVEVGDAFYVLAINAVVYILVRLLYQVFTLEPFRQRIASDFRGESSIQAG